MRYLFFLITISVLKVILLSTPVTAQTPLIFCGSSDNDLYQLLQKEGIATQRYDNLEQALPQMRKGMGVIIISDGYPARRTAISASQFDTIKQKKIRLYIEYPEFIPGHALPEKAFTGKFERGVVSSDFFGTDLPEMSILGINGAHIIPVKVDKSIISFAKVAGFDKAPYGLTDTDVYPLLFKENNLLIATTSLSNFKSARFGPSDSWKTVWENLLSWVSGKKKLTFKEWQTDPSPAYSATAELPANARKLAISNGAEWFWNARLFIHPSWEREIMSYPRKDEGGNVSYFGPPVGKDQLIGDGSRGIMEGHASAIHYDGTQQYRYFLRADVQGESAFLLAASGSLLDNNEYKKTSERLLDYLFYTSDFRGGDRNKKDNDAYGLLSWGYSHLETFFNDDNARCLLGVIGASAFLKNERWNKFVVENILANLRTCSRQGFQGNYLNQKQIQEKGWRYFNERDYTNPNPHFESWMWACYLWLYDKTGYKPLLDKAKAGIEITMDAFPENWISTNGIQQERARMILPLAWLVRVEDTREHRKWLDMVVTKLLESQVSCGAIREDLGSSGSHKMEAFKYNVSSNKAYGTIEASLNQENGDPVSDMLYTSNFAFFALNEAAQATGNARYKEAVNKLSDFLIRIQSKSKNHIDTDGAWFRAFDYNRWDYWASNADAGWGAWSTLTGWIQSWIVVTQVFVETNQSYWMATKDINMKKELDDSLWMLK